MNVDYSGFLQVEADGSIWWPLGDAVKLGAGYLPMRDDHTDLVPVLRALNNRNVADERGLLSELAPDRLTAAHPRILERDGVRFVEAHEFLNWLWKYVKSNPQAAMPLPHALATAVSNARSPDEVVNGDAPAFKSLTLALEDWFDKPLDELPPCLQLRVRNEYSPMLWDGVLSADRRAQAVKCDLLLDPTMRSVHEYWGGLEEREALLMRLVKEWKDLAAPTVQERTIQEERLKELRCELARMDALKRQARHDYDPGRGPHIGQSEATANTTEHWSERYIAYPKALADLHRRLGATPEEIAAWVWHGADDGGLDAFLHVNELDPPPKFSYQLLLGYGPDYLAPLVGCSFLKAAVDKFATERRYITGEKLIERWNRHLGGQAEAFILAQVRDSLLNDFHPTCAGTVASLPDNPDYVPIASGIFDLSEVKAIEAKAFDSPAMDQSPADPETPIERAVEGQRSISVRGQARKLNTQAMYEAWQKAYRKSKRDHPNKSDVWHAKQIAKLPAAAGRDPATIRKHMRR